MSSAPDSVRGMEVGGKLAIIFVGGWDVNVEDGGPFHQSLGTWL